MDRPQYVNWIVREDGVVFEDQQPLNCYRLSYVRDDAILDDWALHIRKQYVPDGELEEDAALNKLTVEEYLRQYIIPQKGEPFGPTARSNDISEILFADLFEFILNYEVPRCKQHNRSGKNESEHGTDIIASTLAQGVNIPIKYLFMTSFMVARNSMQIRSFQNLMGRTARSGMYTEGSVIVTDPQLFDNKNNRRNGGNYKWKDCIKMFDSSAAEPCGSSILSLVQDIRIDYETRVIGAKVAQYIIDHYAETDCFGQCVSKLTAALHKAHPQKSANSIVESMMARKSIVEAIENHLCFVFSIGEDADKQAVAADICKGTLAYFMANDNEKALLERIFDVITSKISELEQSQIKNYARTMVGIKLSLQIEKWIAENHLTQQNYTDEQLVKMLISFFQETHTLKKEIDCFADICQMWLEGCSFVEMHERTSLPIADLEDICSKFISYELSFFVGNVMDIIEINDEDLVNPLPNLLLLQRRLKYGVKTETAVSVCEKIFNDRFLANLLADEIGHDSIEANSIVGVIKSHKDDILDILSAYPTYFSERVQWICKD